MINCMKYHDLRDFLALLEKQGELKRITLPVDPYLEMTEIADRTLRAGGPALFHASIIRGLGLSARHYKELMMRYQQFVMLQRG